MSDHANIIPDSSADITKIDPEYLAALATTTPGAKIQRFDPGEYNLRIVKATIHTTGKGAKSWKLVLRVEDGKFAGYGMWHDIWLTESALSNTASDLEKLGIDYRRPEEVQSAIDRSSIVGLLLRAKVEIKKTKEKTGEKEVNSLDNFCRIDPPAPTQQPPAQYSTPPAYGQPGTATHPHLGKPPMAGHPAPHGHQQPQQIPPAHGGYAPPVRQPPRGFASPTDAYYAQYPPQPPAPQYLPQSPAPQPQSSAPTQQYPPPQYLPPVAAQQPMQPPPIEPALPAPAAGPPTTDALRQRLNGEGDQWDGQPYPATDSEVWDQISRGEEFSPAQKQAMEDEYVQ